MKNKKIYLTLVILIFSNFLAFGQTEKWKIFEIKLNAASLPNRPFENVTIAAEFKIGQVTKTVNGFYDGKNVFKIRFSPDSLGTWIYSIHSNLPELDNKKGEFICIKPTKNNHGYVKTFDTYHFKYADGKRFYPFGTTAYTFINQPVETQRNIISTLSKSGFNKVRIAIFPLVYHWNMYDPDVFAFEGDKKSKTWDFMSPNPTFYQKLEKQIALLDQMGIQCDLILFHPYDRGNFNLDKTTATQDDFYVKYVVSRLAAYKNIWWSLANEYDLIKNKNATDWNRLFEIVKQNDPHYRLRSIHNWQTNYDHSNPNISHVSAQIMNDTTFKIDVLRAKYKKPILWDECKYEGNIQYHWGDLTPQQLTNLFWEAVCAGGYASHGETYLDEKGVMVWARKGIMVGQSPARISFLRNILEAAPENSLEPCHPDPVWWNTCNGVKTSNEEYFLIYLGDRQHAIREFKLSDKFKYKIEIIDTWNMTIKPLVGTFSGTFKVNLPTKPYLAVRATKVN